MQSRLSIATACCAPSSTSRRVNFTSSTQPRILAAFSGFHRHGAVGGPQQAFGTLQAVVQRQKDATKHHSARSASRITTRAMFERFTEKASFR